MKKKFFAMASIKSSAAYTYAALESFFKNTQLAPRDSFMLIDNDGSLDRQKLQPYEGIEYRRNNWPRSFAANLNQAMESASEKGADLYFLNNDLIFSQEWLTAVEHAGDTVAIPASNAQFTYRAGPFQLHPFMDLDDYLGKESYFEAIAAAHRRENRGFRPCYRAPYFCVKIPQAVYDRVGQLDERFGAGGGEDMDYSIRLLQHGFQLGHVLDSFVLHFQGKSTWRGNETLQETRHRNAAYLAAFEHKWGHVLTGLFLLGDKTALTAHPEAAFDLSKGAYRQAIERLMPKHQQAT
ncbi:glycosyltransferase family 2 protein [Pseudohaliea rubra]|uniref:glycosyltransferase family 2 protein n=1 Tax=Pseudohaliea rubra TaxID=475795 RepID=UPI000554B3A7|nr:glycosyltransferase family 2 protein [Pseudohaliea rubra]